MPEYLSLDLDQVSEDEFERDPHLECLSDWPSVHSAGVPIISFSLKDEKAVIQVTIWSGVYQKLAL